MGKADNGQQIIARYLNDFLTTDYKTDTVVKDLRTGEERRVSYINSEDSHYLAEHKTFIANRSDIMSDLLRYFVPTWFDTNYNWAVCLHADKCILVIKGLDKNYSYFLSKDEAAPAMHYARKKNHLVDQRFGASVDLSHPAARRLIENAKQRRPAHNSHWYKKHAIVEEFRILQSRKGPKAELVYLPTVGS